VNRTVGIRFNQTTFVPITLAPLPGWINGTVFPGNATVTVNGAPIAVTNGTYTVQEGLGTYWVNASSPGYYSSASGPLTMGPFGRLVSNVTLVLILGNLVGTILPTSATVLVDDQTVNLTSGSFSINLTPGPHSVSVSAHQYIPATTTATVVANLSTRVTLSLRLSPGWIAGTVSPSNATLTVDDRPVVVSLSGAFNVSVKNGTHALNASVPGFGAVARSVVVVAAATTHESIVLKPLAAAGLALSGTTLGLIGLLILAVAVLVGFLVWRRRRPPPGRPEPNQHGPGDGSGP
jgi:hypothetical protein